MERLLAQLTQKKASVDRFRPLPANLVKNLEEWFKVELTYTSNALEGNTLTRAETALVVEKGITVAGKSMKEHLEATNHAEAFDDMQTMVHKKRVDITEQDILDLHAIFLKSIETDFAGRYRTVPARLVGSRTILPNPLKVPELMKDFFSWLHEEKDEHPVVIAAKAHLKFVTIHPFIDGNGRTARLLMNLLLLQEGYPVTIIKKEERIMYLNALEKAQVENDPSDFYDLICRAVDRSLDIYSEAIQPDRESNLNIMPEQRFYTTDEVAQILQVDPESVRRYVRNKRLKALKLGGRRIRIEKTDLETFIEKLKT